MLHLVVFFANIVFANNNSRVEKTARFTSTYGFRKATSELSFLSLQNQNLRVIRKFDQKDGYLEIFEKRKDHILFVRYSCNAISCKRTEILAMQELRRFESAISGGSDSEHSSSVGCSDSRKMSEKNRGELSNLIQATFGAQSEESVSCDSESQANLAEAFKEFIKNSKRENLRECIEGANSDYEIYFAELAKINDPTVIPKFSCDYRPEKKRNSFTMFPDKITFEAPVSEGTCTIQEIIGHELAHRSRPMGSESDAAATQNCYSVALKCNEMMSSDLAVIPEVVKEANSLDGGRSVSISAGDRVIPADPPGANDPKTSIPRRAESLWRLAENEARAVPRYTFGDVSYGGTNSTPPASGSLGVGSQASSSGANAERGFQNQNQRRDPNELRASGKLAAEVQKGIPIKPADLGFDSGPSRVGNRVSSSLAAKPKSPNDKTDAVESAGGAPPTSTIAGTSLTKPSGNSGIQASRSNAKPAPAAEPLNARQPASANSNDISVDAEIPKWREQLSKATTKNQLALIAKDLEAKKITIILNDRLQDIWGVPTIGWLKNTPSLTLRQDGKGNITRLRGPSRL